MGEFTQTLPFRPRDRLGMYLRRHYAGWGSVKKMAADLRISPKTAENALAGRWPSDLTLAVIIQRFGRDAVECLFAPEIEPVLARLSAEESDLERQIEAVRARRRLMEGREAGVQTDLFEER